MDSNDAFATWEQRHPDVVQRLPERYGEVARKLGLAGKNVTRAKRELPIDPDLAVVAAEAALVAAADAIIRRAGYRVRGRADSHSARFEFPGLPPEVRRERVLLHRIREARNTALYEQADSLSPAFARDAVAAAERVLNAVRAATSATTAAAAVTRTPTDGGAS